ncbi:HTH-type transcriptional repressor YtrA [Calidithermus terrae]|uniref:HTH-type transcriptional repressor YtrA n=1 Tax=Calidithermus terrae TaxID=1408545 RepID=A0A399EI37_9DEIN|nr:MULTISPECIES: GntR family transcriptional regulator [Calidithermus]RIH84364.1 HTH-type transcriptional repressor YtrA [Calidithermus terrae]
MWQLDTEAGPIYAQIVQGVKRMLANGKLKPGDKLPSARDLATELKVNPNTVIHAFGELEREGLSETRRGLGTFLKEDIEVGRLRHSLLVEAARRFMAEARALGLSPEEARQALQEVSDAG